MFLFLLLLFPFFCFAQIKIVSNYPLKKNNILSVVNLQNLEVIVSMLSSLDEVKSVKVEESEGITIISVERYPTLSKIVYRGLNSFAQEEVSAYLGLLKDAPIKELDEESIRLRLEEFYKDRGFLDINAKVNITTDKSGFATILIELSEGELYFTLGAKISAQDDALAGELKGLLKPIKGRIFKEADFRQEVFKLQDYLVDKGYFDAFVYYTGAQKIKLERPFFEVIIPGEEKPLKKPLKLLGSISEGFNNLFEHPFWTLKALAGRGLGAYATYAVFPGKRFQVTFEGA
ncbi:MAG: hypothetical protein RMJ32_02500, partial [Aquificaceae bacterium]|nr:hypothetical protein [Aquificaceae bacterium]